MVWSFLLAAWVAGQAAVQGEAGGLPLPEQGRIADAVVGPDAVAPPEAGVLELRTGLVRTAERADLRAAGAELLNVNGYGVVQLDGPLTPERQARLEAAGLELGQYLPNYAYVIRLSDVEAEALAELEFVTWVGAFERAWKRDPELGVRLYQTAERQELVAAGLLKVVVVLFDGEAAGGVLEELDALGAETIGAYLVGQQWMIDAIVRPIDVEVLADRDEVQWIEDAPEGVLRNNTNNWILQSNVNGQRPVWDAGIHGENQVAGLIDGTPRESHCAFDDTDAPGTPGHRKFIGWRNASTTDSHGTHTAGTLAGDAGTWGVADTYDGMAFAAKISFSNVDNVFGSPSTLDDRLADAYGDGARAHSNSWGDDSTTAYTTWCRQIDLHSYTFEESMVAFAVTNLSSLRTPENAKNVLAVGASQDTPNQGSHCSGGAGPTADGRRKPEIYAPGCNTQSANSSTSCGQVGLTGTSMACPAIAGAAVLVRQYFVDGYYPTGAEVPANSRIPSGALIRAVLINGAVDMTGISGYPSNTEGWGRLLLDNSLYFTGDLSKLYVEDVRNADGLSTGQQAQYTFTVNSSAVPLRVTLVFTEPAAAVNASNPTINNLDLEVVDPAGTLYRGNVFSGGQSSAGGSADTKNTVEQVHRTSPLTGQYTVRIKGTAVNQGTQGYALVVTGDISTQTCVGPTITGHPASASRCVGGSVTFSVTASGTAPLGYQWRRNGVNIAGATGSSYTIASVTTGDAGSYDCVVSNACGSQTSNAANLTVKLGDFNGDGQIGLSDLSTLLENFGTSTGASYADGDMDSDGDVDLGDLSTLLENFGTSCS